ncbi:MAG TPA: penicillin-binding protein 2, partial [Caldithrix sp.]|nr:penicillin-binding protein 2 [Caldithrix sp.]
MRPKTRKYYQKPDSSPEPAGGTNFRLILVTTLLLLGFLLVLVKLVVVQIIDHDYYKEKADMNKNLREKVAAKRGTIYDRQGRELARDVIQYKVAIVGTLTANKEELVRQVADILNIPAARLLRKVRQNKKFVYAKRRVDAETAQRLRKIKDPGLQLERRLLRVYPFKENAAQIIGFCDVDNKPLGGIEYQYNQFLQGKPGWKVFLRDALGNRIPNLDFAGEEPIDGLDVILTIDMNYQRILEDELKNAVQKNKAVEGVAILLDPRSGEVLAMSNVPGFDPNDYSHYSDVSRKNRAVSDVVEPGSTFKFTVFATALENLNINLNNDILYCENGKFPFHGQTIIDHKPYGWLSLRKILVNSSNIGTMKLMEKLNKRVFYNYVRNFGFGMVSGIDLPGESSGILHSLKKFSKTTHYYMSIGYEVGVTPLQLLNAYAAIANGGRLMKPFVVKSVVDAQKQAVRENLPEVIRQVISPETAAELNSLLTDVVREGTGRKAALEGIAIAGKTGTAQLYNTKTRSHDKRRHLASFVGYFPAENPQFALLVMIRQPRGVYYGGQVAAPCFREMARRICTIAQLQPTGFTRSEPAAPPGKKPLLPDLTGQDLELARNIFVGRGLSIEVRGEGKFVSRQELIK